MFAVFEYVAYLRNGRIPQRPVVRAVLSPRAPSTSSLSHISPNDVSGTMPRQNYDKYWFDSLCWNHKQALICTSDVA